MFKKVLDTYTGNMPLWVVTLGVIAWFVPGPFELMAKKMNWFFALTMFGIGVVLSPADFVRIAKHPRIVFIGSVAQFTVMPFGAYIIAKALHLPAEIAVGLILAGSAPGAMASNVMSYIAKADTAYSVSLTTVSTLLCAVLTPALTKLLAGAILPISFMKMFSMVMLMVIVPLLAGFTVRLLLGRKLTKILPVFPAISVTFIIFICSVVIAMNKSRFVSLSGTEITSILLPALIAVVVLNIYGSAMGFFIAKLFGFSVPQQRTLAIEIGMQNAGLGTVLAVNMFGAQAAIPTAIFVFVCIITASILTKIWRKNDAGKAEKTAAQKQTPLSC